MARGPQRTAVAKATMPTDRALQWGDIPKEGQAHLSEQVKGLGMARSSVEGGLAKLAEARDRPTNNPNSRRKATQRIASLQAIAPHLTDDPITHVKASNARYNLTKAGMARQAETGEDPNHGWYFNHHKRLSEVAEATGHAKDRVIAASAVMSPQNNPEQELTAVHALARAHSDPDAALHITHEAVHAHEEADYQDRLKKARTPAAKAKVQRQPSALRDYAGTVVHPGELAPEHLAALSTPEVREHVGATGVDLGAIAKGGVKGNVVKAIDVLRGNVAVDKAIDPRSSPKVWSYHAGIASSVHGSLEHTEFMERMHVASGRELPGQQRMDVTGMRSATHGPLDPTGPTAEDTWQQAISTRQPLPQIDVPGRQGRAAKQSPAKFSVGEGGAANQKDIRAVPGVPGAEPSALMHAWQNRATHMAAKRLSRESGEIIPAIGIQAGGWIEARRQAGKNIEEQVPVKKQSIKRGIVKVKSHSGAEHEVRVGPSQQMDFGF